MRQINGEPQAKSRPDFAAFTASTASTPRTVSSDAGNVASQSPTQAARPGGVVMRLNLHATCPGAGGVDSQCSSSCGSAPDDLSQSALRGSGGCN